MWKKGRNICLCLATIYIYLICSFVQMDWLLKKTADVALEKVTVNFIGNEDSMLQRKRNLATYEFPEYSRTSDRSLNLENVSQVCDPSKSNECPMQCKFLNASTLGVNKNAENDTVPHVRPDCKLTEVLKDCTHFKKLYQYNTVPVMYEEKNFPLAFSMKMHHHPEHAEKILRAIYRDHNIYCIHIDDRADQDTLKVMDTISKCFTNVKIIRDRERMTHASYAHVMSDIKCMRAVSTSNIPWKYYINLSGEEFPLKTNLEMVAILQFFDGMNDIETYDHPVGENWKIENKFNHYGNSLAQGTRKTDFRYKMKFSKGYPFGLFSREFVDFIFKDSVARDIINWFNDTYAPHENVWATLVTLPWAPGGYPVTVRHMISTFVSRAMIFTGDNPVCHGRFVRGYCQFGCGDLPWLQSRPEFFTSKLDLENSGDILNCLCDWYRSKALRPDSVNINWDFYTRLPHVKFHSRKRKLSEQMLAEVKTEWLRNNTRQTM